MHYIGTVTLLVSLSDTGYVCEVQVLRGINDDLNKQAVEAIQNGVFQPIRQNGKPIPGSLTVRREFWRGDTSDFLISQNLDATPDEINANARAFNPLDLGSVLKTGIIENEKYQNKYFELSLIAPGAVFRTPPLSDGEDRNALLVEAEGRGAKPEDIYTISVRADRLSNYPQLKSRAQYVDGLSAQLIQGGAKQMRDDFPFLISDIEFVGTILRESDGPGIYHFRGLLSTVLKGYVLTLDVAAPSEERVLKAASAIKIEHQQ